MFSKFYSIFVKGQLFVQIFVPFFFFFLICGLLER